MPLLSRQQRRSLFFDAHLWLVCMESLCQILVRVRLNAERCLYRKHLWGRNSLLSAAFCGQDGFTGRERSNGIGHAPGALTAAHFEQERQLTAKALQHHVAKSLRVLLQPGQQQHIAVC